MIGCGTGTFEVCRAASTYEDLCHSIVCFLQRGRLSISMEAAAPRVSSTLALLFQESDVRARASALPPDGEGATRMRGARSGPSFPSIGNQQRRQFRPVE